MIQIDNDSLTHSFRFFQLCNFCFSAKSFFHFSFFFLVPDEIPEELFWMRYFFRISRHEKQIAQIHRLTSKELGLSYLTFRLFNSDDRFVLSYSKNDSFQSCLPLS